MRFHFGFSKFIKPSQLIKWIGIIFIGLLAYFGLVEHGYAWTNISSNETSVFNSYVGEYYDLNDNSLPVKYNGTDILRKGSSPYYSFAINDNTSNYWLHLNAVSQGYINLEPTYGSRILSYTELQLNNPGYCPNSTTDLKSMNIKFPVYVDNFLTDYSFFNQTNQSSTISFRMISYDDTHDYKFTTTCSHELVGGYGSGYYLVTCSNVFAGNSNYSIDRYGIQINNSVPFNDFYSSSTQSKGIGFWYEIGPRMVSFQNANIKYLFSYECSDNDPVLNEPIPGGDDDPNGLNDIYNVIQDNFDSSIPGIDTSKFTINLPSTIGDLLTMPFDLVQSIVDNSLDSQCQPYEIDFSSIMQQWGGGNHDQSYVLQLPCMRSKLKSLLGNTLYTIIDSMIAFYVFYNMVMFFIHVIDAITSGQDLFTYFFKDSEDEILVSTYDGSYTRKKHWYE